LIDLFPSHDQMVIDLFGGSAEVAILCKQAGYEQVVWNDIHPFLFDFHQLVADGRGKEIYEEATYFAGRRISDVMEHYDATRKRPKQASAIECAALIYLMNASCSTMGRRDVTQWKVPRDVSKASPAARALGNMALTTLDFLAAINRYDSAESFFFIDPPWPEEHFEDNLNDSRFIELVKKLCDLKGRFLMVLGGNRDDVLPMVQDLPYLYSRRAVRRGQQTRELVVSNYPLVEHKEIRLLDRAEYNLPVSVAHKKAASTARPVPPPVQPKPAPESRARPPSGKAGRRRSRSEPLSASVGDVFLTRLATLKKQGWLVRQEAYEYYASKDPTPMDATTFHWVFRNGTDLDRKNSGVFDNSGKPIEVVSKRSIDKLVKKRQTATPVGSGKSSRPATPLPRVRPREDARLTGRKPPTPPPTPAAPVAPVAPVASATPPTPPTPPTRPSAPPAPPTPEGPTPEGPTGLLSIKDAHEYYMSVAPHGVSRSLFSQYAAHQIIESEVRGSQRLVDTEAVDVFLLDHPSGNVNVDGEHQFKVRLDPDDLNPEQAYEYYAQSDPSPISYASFMRYASNHIVKAIRKATGNPHILGFDREDIDDFLRRRGHARQADPEQGLSTNTVEPRISPQTEGLVELSVAYDHYRTKVDKPLSKSWFHSKVADQSIRGVKVHDSKTPHPSKMKWMVDLRSVDRFLAQTMLPSPRRRYDKIESVFKRCGDIIPKVMLLSTFKRLVYEGRILSKRTGPNGGGPYLVCRQDVEDYFSKLRRRTTRGSKATRRRRAASGSPAPRPERRNDTTLTTGEAYEYYLARVSNPVSLTGFRSLLLSGDIEACQMENTEAAPILVDRASLDRYIESVTGEKATEPEPEPEPEITIEKSAIAARTVAPKPAAPEPEVTIESAPDPKPEPVNDPDADEKFITLRVSEVKGDLAEMIEMLTARGYQVRIEP